MAHSQRSMQARLGHRWFELLLAGRLLRSRRSVHLSLVTSMSVAGIALGVAALIVVLAVNTGFQAAFQDRILATYPHLVVMRRGVDLEDYREVAAKLERVEGVRDVAPATYDDMMLSGAAGRAGAVVRGVPLTTLRGLPEGAVVAGHLDTAGETPQVQFAQDGLNVTAGVAAARHVLVAGGKGTQRWLRTVPVLAQPAGLAGLVVFDAQGCPAQATGSAAKDESRNVFLINPDTDEVVRRADRKRCDVAVAWATAPGSYVLRWFADGAQQTQRIELGVEETQVAVLSGAKAHVVAPPPLELASSAAAIAVASLEPGALAVHLPDAVSVAVSDPPQWIAFAGTLPSIALGEGLAKRLQVNVGDEVRAVSPMRGMDRGAESASASALGRFRVSAILRTGFHDHDQRLALCDFRTAQRFLGRGDIARWVEVRVTDPILASSRVEAFRAALEPTTLSELLSASLALRRRLVDAQESPSTGLEIRAPDDAVGAVDNWVTGIRVARQGVVRSGGAYRVLDWEEMNRNIFDAARMQKIAMSLFPFIIVLVAALNVVGTQAVVVHERARDIAILRAMGATRRSVAAIFLAQGFAVGLAGTVIGLSVGGLACLALDAIGYPLDPQVYLISRLPVLVQPASFLLAGGAATLLAFAAAWFAAQRAAGKPPVEALRRLD